MSIADMVNGLAAEAKVQWNIAHDRDADGKARQTAASLAIVLETSSRYIFQAGEREREIASLSTAV